MSPAYVHFHIRTLFILHFLFTFSVGWDLYVALSKTYIHGQILGDRKSFIVKIKSQCLDKSHTCLSLDYYKREAWISLLFEQLHFEVFLLQQLN